MSVRNIEELIADEVANLFDIERAMEEIVEARGCLRIGGVVDTHKIFCDPSVLFEFRRLSKLNVMHEPGPTFKTVFASDDELSVRQDRIGNVRFVFAQPLHGGRIVVAQLLEQFFSSFAK